MQRNVSIFLTLLVVQVSSFSQSTKARIENVSFDVVDKKIVVIYDISRYSPVERFQVNLQFVTDKNETINPITVFGDVGNEIKGGKNKKIVWDFIKDGVKLKGINLEADVTVASVKEDGGGPSNAFLSILIPGLGDRYVSNSRKAIIKPYFFTIATYGMLGMAIYESSQYNSYNDTYNNYSRLLSKDPSNTSFRNNMNIASNNRDAALNNFIAFSAIGASIWAVDILWVTFKGIKNNNARKAKLRTYLAPELNPFGQDANFALKLTLEY